MSRRVLVVEDDLALRTGLVDALAGEGYDVASAVDGQEATELLYARHWDVVVLDLMLPLKGGLEILRELRTAGIGVPVLVLTARGDENDRVLGLDLGADDYVTKPFSLRELLARVKALLRRAAPPPEPSGEDGRFHVGDVEVDVGAYQVLRDGEVLPLSPTEAAMLLLLHREAGRVVSRGRFLAEIWGDDAIVGGRTVDTHMLNLRQKVERDPRQPRFLVTVHGAGYRLDGQDPEDGAPRSGS